MERTQQLLGEISNTIAALRRLTDHSKLIAPPVITAVKKTVEQVERRLARNELSVIMAGERGAGKTTFLDALIGDRALDDILGPSRVLTSLHRRPVHGYRAKFATGAVEDFARRVPDRREEISERLRLAQQALAEAQEAVTEGTAVAEERNQAVVNHEQGRKQAFVDLEASRDNAQRVRGDAAVMEHEAHDVDTAIAELERTIPPSVRERPPWWAFWLWILIAYLALFRREEWKSYALRRKQREEVRALLPAAREKATEALEKSVRAENRLAQYGQVLAELRGYAVEASEALAQHEQARDRAAAEGEMAQRELTDYAEQRLRRFFIDLMALVGERGKREHLVELAIDYPTRLLPEDLAVVQVPGVMEGDAKDEEHAWAVIREEADGCILVSELESGVSMRAKRFLQQIREVVPRVLLVLTKMDQAFAEAVERGGADPWEQVEQARRIGTRRFAREIGREPHEVLSIAVAAESVVRQGAKKSAMTQRFDDEVKKLFELLRHERALILGERSATAIRRCISGIAEAEERAEQAYQERISKLESQRLPDPRDFHGEQVAAAEGMIASAADNAVEAANVVLRDGFAILRTYTADHITKAKSKQEIVEAAERLEAEIANGVARLRADAHMALESGIDQAVRQIESIVFEALRQRYQILYQVRREMDSAPRLDLSLSDERPPPPLRALAERTIASFGRQRIGLGVGGVAAGAAIGTAILPGLGSAAGAAVGVLLGFVRTNSALKNSAVHAMHAALESEQEALSAELAGRAPGVATAIRESLDRSLERAMTRFARWLSEPIEAEREAIEKERAMLADLQLLEIELQDHDAKLGELMKL